jgi:two-component system LytT family sensor kinase
VPTLILRLIVENAVIHGIGPKVEGGALHIVLNEVGDDLLLQVDDDGVGFDINQLHLIGEGAREKSPIGSRNVDERLRMLYGDAHRLLIESAPERGTRVVIRIPLKQANG